MIHTRDINIRMIIAVAKRQERSPASVSFLR